MPANRTQSPLDFGTAGNWNAIEARARDFVKKWRGETYERGESQSFWSDFLSVFGIDRKRAGVFFEYRTRKLNGAPGYVDLFWPGKLIAEQKSAGRNLGDAIIQALDYLPELPDHELPRAVVASDFATFEVVRLDMESQDHAGRRPSSTFPLEELPGRVRLFAFLFDAGGLALSEQNPVNSKAAQGISGLHRNLREQGYTGEDLELFLTRVVFCLFAEDTGIFEPGQFSAYVRTQASGNVDSLGRILNELFEILDTEESSRQKNTPPLLGAFRYVNGGLFQRTIRTPQIGSGARVAISKASEENWADVNPGIFGSMFQEVMEEEGTERRRDLGAHYTSEKNILRLIQPLFLDELYAEFEAVKNSPGQLERFHDKIANLKFLDPACGSGNFLVIAYRELRRLEHKVLKARMSKLEEGLDVAHLIRVTPDQMAGIELEEFPAKVAQLALWLTDHQMNIEAAKMFGGSIDLYARIPIKSQPHIVNANALRIDWGDVVELSDLDYIIGNPPFSGKKEQTKEQRKLLQETFKGVKGLGILDFVCAWYKVAMDCIDNNPKIRAALVSTNSITQGEHVPVLWPYLFARGAYIDFAHRTFKWKNEAPGIAAVYCVIVGFSKRNIVPKKLYSYADISKDPTESIVDSINAYLVDAPNIAVESRRSPIVPSIPRMNYGSMPIDDGHLTLRPDEADEILVQHPSADKWIRHYVGGREFLRSQLRYCLWLQEIRPEELRSYSAIMKRVAATKEYRSSSGRPQTVKLAETPTLFGEIRQPKSEYLLFPKVSSETRKYLPIGFMPASVIASGSALVIPEATKYDFGILQSAAHNDWMRSVAGRMKSDYQYSAQIVYNNFPWPENVTDAQRAKIEELAQAVLDARAAHPTSTLADLYDPLAMPANLRKAHIDLDRAVDRLYRSKPFADDAERVAMLLKMYQRLVGE